MSDLDKITRIADDLIAKELAPRLRDVHKKQSNSPVDPAAIAIAAAALHLGVWDEKTVKQKLDKAFGG